MNIAVSQKLQDFFKSYPPRTYKKGEIIIFAGENPKGIIFLKSGQVAQYHISDSGQKVILNIFKPGAFFPMSWAVNHTENNYFYEAASQVECRIAPPQDVLNLLNENHDITFDLLSRVYRGTDGLLQRMSELMVGSARSRLLLEILISAYRFGNVRGNSAEVSIKTTDLAQRTGITRETASRELNQLARDGVISKAKGKIIIDNLENLPKLT